MFTKRNNEMENNELVSSKLQDNIYEEIIIIQRGKVYVAHKDLIGIVF